MHHIGFWRPVKIVQPMTGFLDRERIRSDLQRLLTQPVPADSPPCLGCKEHFPPTCSSKCAQAPQSLSTEPINYPIETNVVPLVFELAATRLMQPCWSCEGHLNPLGDLWKLPQVSFYSASTVYPQLLIKHIYALEFKKQLSYPWHIILSDYGQTWETTYTLEPNLNREHKVHLGNLQRDLNTLADGLCNKLKSLAQSALSELS